MNGKGRDNSAEMTVNNHSMVPATVPLPIIQAVQTSSEAASGIQFYLRVLLNYRALILSVFTVVLGTVALYAFTRVPRYTAKATARIDVYQPILGSVRLEDVLQRDSSRQEYLETQIQQIRSLSLADLVLRDPEVRGRFEAPPPGWFSRVFGSGSDQAIVARGGSTSGYVAPASVIQRYLKNLTVAPVRRTSLVEIRFRHEDPVFAALVANRHAAEYIDWIRNLRIEQQSRGVAFLSSQTTELRERVADLERQIAEYAESNSIVAVNKDENITVQKMAGLNQMLTASLGKLAEITNRAAQAKQALTKDSSAFDDDAVRQTRLELAKGEAELAELSKKYQQSYPRVDQSKGQVDRLRRSVREQRAAIVRGLETEALAVQNEVRSLSEELDRQKSQAFELSRRQVEYNALSRELDTTRDLLLSVSKQMKEVSLAVESNGSNIVLVDRAIIPRTPSEPQKLFLLCIGSILGLAGGVGLALLLDHLDTSVRTPEDVQNVLGLATLGVIPSFSRESVGLGAGEEEEHDEIADDQVLLPKPGLSRLVASAKARLLVAGEHGRSPVSEAYRTIRTNIIISRPGGAPRVILVTSALPAEGKTTISANLAVTLAQNGARVVVVDADLRKPSIHLHFQISPKSAGVTDVITGGVELGNAIQSTKQEGVFVLPSGSLPPNPAALVGSQEMRLMLQALAEGFDYVIVDSAPLVPISDTMLVTRHVDGVVMVVRGGSTPVSAALEAKHRAVTSGAQVLGAVLNDVDVMGRDYYYYRDTGYYGTYYGEQGRSTRSNNVAAAG